MKPVASMRALLGLGDAEGGTDHWWGQRISGIALVLLGLWFVLSVLSLPSLEYHIVVEFVGRSLNNVLLSLLCLAAAYHSNLGVQVVIEDYVHAATLHKASIVISRIAHLLLTVVAVFAVIRIGNGT
jgi:succinate dehydrogenase / fumarate reductase membrane anchor subunit